MVVIIESSCEWGTHYRSVKAEKIEFSNLQPGKKSL